MCTLLALLLFSTSLGTHMPAGYLSLEPQQASACASSSVQTAYVRPHTGEYVAPKEDEWTWEHVQDMVAGTRGFYARDWPLQLGWNNVRALSAIFAPLLFSCTLNVSNWDQTRLLARKGYALAFPRGA